MAEAKKHNDDDKRWDLDPSSSEDYQEQRDIEP